MVYIYMYLHLLEIYDKLVDKYTSPIDPMGIGLLKLDTVDITKKPRVFRCSVWMGFCGSSHLRVFGPTRADML